MIFKKGDMVQWKSQSGGVLTTKTGKVVFVLNPNSNPVRVWNKHKHTKYKNELIARTGELTLFKIDIETGSVDIRKDRFNVGYKSGSR